MAIRHDSRLLGWAGRLASGALLLAACAAPTAVPPTATLASTATALPPTAAATPQSTARPNDLPVRATSIRVVSPGTVAFDANNNMYLSECEIPLIYRINPYGQLTIYAGTGGFGFSGDGGPARSAHLSCPTGLAFDHAGNLYVADANNNRIRRIDTAGIITTVAGIGGVGSSNEADVTGGFGGDGGPATSARLNFPASLAFDAGGNLYIADAQNNRIRKIDTAGIITTVAGTGEGGFSGDGGPATAAELNRGCCLAFDAHDNLYLSDGFNARVRKIDQQGIITTVAGIGQQAVSGDGGRANAAALTGPGGLAFDAAGNLYIACTASPLALDTRIRKVDTQGIITTAYGTGAMGGDSGDGGPATQAAFSGLGSIVFDPNGNLYVVDANAVRRIDTKGIITTVVGGAP